MRIAVYDANRGEFPFYQRWEDNHPGWSLTVYEREPRVEDFTGVSVEAISVSGGKVDAEIVEAANAAGCRSICTRSIGYDNIDLNAVRRAGMKSANISYSSYSVAEYAVLLMLMVLRKSRQMLRRFDSQDFRADHLEGQELHGKTVGIIGAGSIGMTVARCLSGFGCTVLASDPYPRDGVADLVTFVDLDELLRRSDIITLHAALTAENYHLIDAAAIAKMKPGAIVINCARGPLVDSSALVDALVRGTLGGAGLDVLEGEEGLFFRDCSAGPIDHREFAQLRSLPNVVMSSHLAYLTREVVEQTVERGLGAIVDFAEGRPVPGELC